MKKGIYPGSFDPLTLGHINIIKRALKIVDSLTIAIGNNTAKNCLFEVEERVEIIQDILKETLKKDYFKIEIKTFNGLLVDFAAANNIPLIIRGIRALSDFDFEFTMAGANNRINPKIDTIFLMAEESTQFISSKIAKEIFYFGGDTSKFLPLKVVERLKEKKIKKR